MSNSQNFSDSKKSGKAPEKSNFSQTCNLLSQYLKEKGSLRDLNLESSGKVPEAMGKPETCRNKTTLNLLNSKKMSGQTSTQPVKSMDLLPQFVSTTAEDATDNSKQETMEPKTAQMTIFYAGQVMVFDEFPADKAREVVQLASKGSSVNTVGPVSTSSVDKIDHGSSVAASGSNTQIPIARRASLHRFLEKRKDRATARAPYQVHNPSTAEDEEQLELKL